MTPQLLEYALSEGVMAFSTTRHGGCSKGLFGSFNINPYCGDDSADVEHNLQALSQELQIRVDNIVLPHQVHDIECRQIAKEFLSLPDNVRKMLLEGVDALVTDLPGVCIGVSTADCIPVLLYDEAHHAVAAIHAGWRGTLRRIVQKTVLGMHNCYDTHPEQLKAVIGPGISLQNFEVGQDVYDQFAQGNFDMDAIAKMYDKWHINLPLCNQLQLEESGIPSENILHSDVCTYDRVDDFFSARRLGVNSGRIFTGIMLR